MDAPEELVGNEEAARYVSQLLGRPVRPKTWSSYVSRGQAPRPYRREIVNGHALPVWRRSRLDMWARTRPGQGRRTDLIGG